MNGRLQRSVNNLALPGPGIKRFLSVNQNPIRNQGRSFREKVGKTAIKQELIWFTVVHRKPLGGENERTTLEAKSRTKINLCFIAVSSVKQKETQRVISQELNS